MGAQILFSSITLLISAVGFAYNPIAFAEKNVSCYQFKMDTGETKAGNIKPHIQTWCYHQGVSAKDPLFVFNADQPEIKPETSFIVDAEDYITHGSLLVGEVTFHKVKGNEFNPFPIPFREPKNLKPITLPRINSSSAESVLNTLSKQIIPQPSQFILEEGEFTAFEQASIMPWRGFWWPYKNQTLYGTQFSPLAKYDRFIQARGKSGGARGWESTHHRYSGVWWEGHCNGWAASSVLRSEPRFAKTDTLSGVTFSVADQKGILAEMDYCSISSFFGNRYRGRSTDNPRDILPALFHKTLTYYIGNLHKPVVIDYRPDVAVDNHPVSAYTMEITQVSPGTYNVTATLTFHKYDTKRNWPPGIAPRYTRVYKYTLNKNERGEITGGYWRSTNPDFIWVPLGLGDCSSNNPFMDLGLVQKILNLPPAAGSPVVIF